MDADPGFMDAIYSFWLEFIWRPLKNPSNSGALMAVVAVTGLIGGILP